MSIIYVLENKDTLDLLTTSQKISVKKFLGYIINNVKDLIAENDVIILHNLIKMKKYQEKLNLLFVCSRNQWRSPTAEKVWSNHPKLNVRSAGTSPSARKKITPKDIQWADMIFVMEKKHKNRIVAKFTRMVDYKPIHVLDIPDEYKYMDDELVELVNLSVANILGLSELSLTMAIKINKPL